MADSETSSLSSLSSAPPTDDEAAAMELNMSRPTGLNKYFKPAPKPKKEDTPEPPKRAPSPPHEYTLADNDAIAVLVMFRSRFSDAFPKSLPHYGPQDIERGVSAEFPDEQVERYLCALLGLVLNRKKDVERGHYGRALEDAISSNQTQWPTAWKGTNPLHGGKNFNNMTPEERLTLLKTLALWALNTSEAVQAIIKESYKQTRRDDDKNQPRSVQPWFSDSYRRRYWLVEGQDDSFFRIFRENDGKTAKSNTWFSVAGSIEEVNALADKFTEEGTSNARVNAEKLRSAVPRFEAGEEKRRRKEYRLARKAAFSRPEPGYSLYEGRTRGKRMKYTYSDGEEELDSDMSTRQSTRNETPLNDGPTVTASGRQVKPRMVGQYGEPMLPDQRREFEQSLGESGVEDSDDMPTTSGRPMRSSVVRSRRPPASRTREVYTGDEMSDEESEAQSSGKEWSGNEDDPDDDADEESEGDFEDEVSGEEDEDDGDANESLVVKLSYRKKPDPAAANVNGLGQGMRINGLPMLAPKPQNQPPTQQPVQPPQQHHVMSGQLMSGFSREPAQKLDDNTIEVAPKVPTNTNDTLDRYQQHPSIPSPNGYDVHNGGVENALPVAKSPHPLSQVQMQAMDVS